MDDNTVKKVAEALGNAQRDEYGLPHIPLDQMFNRYESLLREAKVAVSAMEEIAQQNHAAAQVSEEERRVIWEGERRIKLYSGWSGKDRRLATLCGHDHT